jgi:DNA replication protein DnaC
MDESADRREKGPSPLLGSCPPYRLCPECGAQSDEPWENPILAWMLKQGIYQGPTQGGYQLCDACEPIVKARLDKEGLSAPSVPNGMPTEFIRARLDNYEQRETNRPAVAAAFSFLKEGAQQDLFLCGGVGTGKTRLACTIANEVWAKSHRSVRFVRVPVLLLKLQEGMRNESEHASVSEYAEPGLLVLDDVGVEKGSDYSRRTLQTLYDMRRDAGRRTIWTSNLDLEALSLFLDDDRLPSRIAGAADVVFLDGTDQRVARRQQRARTAGGRRWGA